MIQSVKFSADFQSSWIKKKLRRKIGRNHQKPHLTVK